MVAAGGQMDGNSGKPGMCLVVYMTRTMARSASWPMELDLGYILVIRVQLIISSQVLPLFDIVVMVWVGFLCYLLSSL